MDTEPYSLRVMQKGLLKLDKNGRPCEVCGLSMYDHEWADLDINGFVTACSINEATGKVANTKW